MILADSGGDDQGAPWPRWERLALLSAMVLTALLTAPVLGDRSFYFDEICSVDIARHWTGMYHTFATYENNMALYYVLLHGWMAVFGEGEAAVRCLSLLFALAALPVVHLLARRLLGARAGIIATLLLAVSLPFLTFAQEARSYSLLLLLSTLAVLLFVSGLRRPRWQTWMGFTVVAAASVYAHYFGLFNAGACFAAALLMGCWPGLARPPWRYLLVAGCGIALLIVPLAVVRPADGSQIDWIGRPTLKLVSACVTYMAGAKSSVFACLLLVGYALWGLARSRPEERHARTPSYVLLIAVAVLPALVALAVSLFIRPIFMPKYLLGSLPALYVLVAAGIARLPTRLAVAAVAVMLLPNADAIRREGAPHISDQDWRGLTAMVAAAARPGDCAICHPFCGIRCFRFYLARQAPPHPELEPHELASAPYHPGGGTAEPPPDLAALDHLCHDHPRLWMIMRQDPPDLTDHLKNLHVQALLARLTATYQTRTEFHAAGVQALLFADPH